MFILFLPETALQNLPHTLKSQRKWCRYAYANTEMCKHSEYGAVVNNTYRRAQVSGTGIRSVTTAAMASYHDLSEFECDVIVELVHEK